MIAEHIRKLRDELGRTELVAVSKYRSTGEIMEAYAAGQRIFAENRVQALLERASLLPKDIRWHLIGHLQKNKVKMLVPVVECIQSVDSMELLNLIGSEAVKAGKMVDCLLQVRIADEETKFGMQAGECIQMMKNLENNQPEGVRIRGLMGMATLTKDENKIKREFQMLADLYHGMKDKYAWDTLSMGMSSDYKIALTCGSTMVRIGSLLFEP